MPHARARPAGFVAMLQTAVGCRRRVFFIVATVVTIVSGACGGATLESGSAASNGADADADAGSADADAATREPARGAFGGPCFGGSIIDASSGMCDPGLVCEAFQQDYATEQSFDNVCGGLVCTHPCDTGCDSPSSGCSTDPDLVRAGVVMNPVACAPPLCHR